MSQITRLSIAGVPSRLALRVAGRRDGHVTLEQRLPFLAIGTDVTGEGGELGRIERVGVVLEGGVPKIVLEVAYDPMPARVAVPSAIRPRRDQTMSYDQRPSLRAPRIDQDNQPPRDATDRDRALAFPLENRRVSLGTRRGGWLARLFAPLVALFSTRVA